MDRRRQRALRGILAATLAVFVAAWFHTASGGAAPSILAMVVSTVLAAPACVLLAGRRPALWRLALSVALSQFAFHFLFGLGQPSDVRFSGDTTMAGMPGMHLQVTGGGSTPSALGTATMWAGHAVAALLTIAAIRHGEGVLRRTLGLAARFLVVALRLAAALPLPSAGPVRPRFLAPRALRPHFLVSATRHRGPPLRVPRSSHSY
jgi:hypothetical protein